MAASWLLWKSELKNPTPEDRRQDRPTDPHLITGFWRIDGARTKPAWPVAIWTEDGQEATIFQIGMKIQNTVENEAEWHDFTQGSWLKCEAVTKAQWSDAMQSGYWADGRPARHITPEEKADIIPSTPASEGGNQPVDEDGNPIDEFYEQVKAKLAAAAEKADKLGPITTLEAAEAAAKIVEDIATVGKLGEAQRKKEKQPHDDAAAAVQAKWVPILGPASELATKLKNLIQKFKDAEEARLRREAEQRRREEEQRIRDEEAKRIAEEAAQAGEQLSETAIAQMAEQSAAEQVAAMPEPETKVRVGTATGRGISVAKRKVGVITDPVAFFAAVKDDADIKEALQKKANALARAGTALAGMQIEKE